MRRRYFEKYVQKKKPDPNLLEIIAVLSLTLPFFCLAIVMDLCSILHINYYIEHGGRIVPVSRTLVMADGAKYLYLIVLIESIRSLYVQIKYFISPSGKTSRNVVFIDERKNPAGMHYLFGKTTSFLYAFFREPYIYRMHFLVDTYTDESYSCFRKPIYFNLPPHRTYDNETDNLSYETRYKEDERKTDLKRSKHFRYKGNSYKYNGKDYHQYTYYITYQKAQALNRLFEIVELPAFRIVVSEERQFLHEIHPMEGREYPEEAYELMEKINQMYP